MGLLLLMGNVSSEFNKITNAAAAYSLRKLRSSYSGSAIRVRRESDNTESDIGFSDNDLDTASLASFCSGTNGFVTTWYDQTTNARNATQATTTAQPQIVSSGSVITANSKPAIDFVANSYFLQTATLNITQAFSVYQVINFDSISTVQFVWTTSTVACRWLGMDTNVYRAFAGSGIDSGAIVTATQNQLTTLFNGASSYIRRDGTQISSGNVGAATLNDLRIGAPNFASQYFNGKFQELFVYASDNTAGNATIESDQKSYWGTP